jgi:hypothetical protein
MVKVCEPVVEADDVEERVSERIVPRRRVKTA